MHGNLKLFKYFILIFLNFYYFSHLSWVYPQTTSKEYLDIPLQDISSFTKKDHSSPTKIELKLNYQENLYQPDFFFNDNQDKYLEIGQLKDIHGVWIGSFQLTDRSLYWINSKLDRNRVLRSVKYGPYKMGIQFETNLADNLIDLRIVQKEVNYESINFQIYNKKQINYWANVSSDKWYEVVRGKIFRVNQKELLTIFQTTVYEGKTPIYAFEGVAVLNKVKDSIFK